VPTLVAILFNVYNGAMTGSMKEARSILCDNDLHYFSAVDQHFKMLWYEKRDPSNMSERWDSLAKARSNSMKQLIHGMDATMGNNIREPPFTLLALENMPVAPFGDMADQINPGCVDMLAAQDFLSWMQIKMDNSSIKSCDDIEYFCTIPYVRLLCAQQCGCDMPNSVIGGSGSSLGCPSSCTTTWGYAIRLSRLGCADEDLRQTTFWRHWIKHAKNTLIQSIGDKAYAENMSASMENGCAWLENVAPVEWKRNLCSGDDTWLNLRPLAPLCPTTCGCHLGAGHSSCPGDCTALG